MAGACAFRRATFVKGRTQSSDTHGQAMVRCLLFLACKCPTDERFHKCSAEGSTVSKLSRAIAQCAADSGGRFVLVATSAEHFDLLVFYRGLHCPVCVKYYLELVRLGEAFINRGVVATVVSSDGEDRAFQVAPKVESRSHSVRLWPQPSLRPEMGVVHQRITVYVDTGSRGASLV